jgi:predicted transcriptional regulator YheO
VVEELQARGVFLLRDAVEMVAEALSVSKFTIYNYLNELSASGDDSSS